jgi:hypothetical protein
MHESNETVERWLPIPDYEGVYEVSDLGQVRSLDRIVWCSNNSWTQFFHGIILKQYFRYDQPKPYPTVNLCKDLKLKVCPVHRLVLTAFVGPRPPNEECRHLDGNSKNSRLSNLIWGTKIANALDKKRHGTEYNSNKKSCPRGHLLESPNLVGSIASEGRRGCFACARARGNRQHARQYGHPFDIEASATLHYAKIMNEVKH